MMNAICLPGDGGFLRGILFLADGGGAPGLVLPVVDVSVGMILPAGGRRGGGPFDLTRVTYGFIDQWVNHHNLKL
jgi:hypothetical protein